MLRKVIYTLLVLILIPVVAVVGVSYHHADLSALPPLESGDLIFQTALSPQAEAIISATASLYTHVGIVHKQGDNYTVIQAGRTVIETPLNEFIGQGWGQQFTIRRYPDLSDAQREAIVHQAQSYLGRGYNYVFYLKSPDTVYCSELPYLVFSSVHLPIGNEVKIGSLHVNNSAVKKIFEMRWKIHPACQGEGMNYESCWKAVMAEPIITPTNIAHDPRLVTLYSNYIF